MLDQPVNQRKNLKTSPLVPRMLASRGLCMATQTALLGSVTDILHYNCDCAYANEFPVAVEDSDVGKLRTTAQEVIGLHGMCGGGGIIWLEGFLGSEPRLVMSKVRFAAKFRHLGEADTCDGNRGRAPSFLIILWHSPYNWGKNHGGILSQGSEKYKNKIHK